MKKVFEHKFQVRGNELDSFGHVNNAVYINYLEQARWEIIRDLGELENLRKAKMFLIVVETNIKYIYELGLFDKATVKTTFERRGFFIEFKQDIYDERNKKVTKAKIKCLFVDENRKPTDIPEKFMIYFND